MTRYTIELLQLSERRHVANILKDGNVHATTHPEATQDDARRSGNLKLTHIEHANGHWDGDHAEATYHYLAHGVVKS